MEKISQNFLNKIKHNLNGYRYIEISTQNGEGVEHNIINDYYKLWDDKNIKLAFNFGNGTEKDFLSYANDNKNLAKFYKL